MEIQFEYTREFLQHVRDEEYVKFLAFTTGSRDKINIVLFFSAVAGEHIGMAEDYETGHPGHKYIGTGTIKANHSAEDYEISWLHQGENIQHVDTQKLFGQIRSEYKELLVGNKNQ